MATVNFLLKGSNPATIYIRFRHGREIDYWRSTSLLINPDYWDTKKGKVKNIASFKDKKNLQNSLNNLSNRILNKFNDDYTEGEIISSDWLKTTIHHHFNQSNEVDINNFTSYAEYFHENLSHKVQPNGKTGVTTATKKKYRTIINKVEDFERFKKTRLRLTDINSKFHKDFIHFLHDIQNLNYNTIGKYLIFVKTICLDAKKYGLKVHKDISNGEFRPTKENVSFITLNENEIHKIQNKNLSNKPYLDNAKKWLIIGVWTGARVSDLLKLSAKNVNNGFIEYTAKKTGQKIILPVHPQVIDIIENDNGNFPKPISSQKFNDYIKEVCRLAGIAEVVTGSKLIKTEKKQWRKVKGDYPKHKLVSTHICRRSFATNHYGKLPTPVIMAVTGHTTEKMFLQYIGKTAKDNANELQRYWAIQEMKKSKEPQLGVVRTGTEN